MQFVKLKKALRTRIWDDIRRWFPKESYGYNEALSDIFKTLKNSLQKLENPYKEGLRIYSREFEIGFERCRGLIIKLLEEDK